MVELPEGWRSSLGLEVLWGAWRSSLGVEEQPYTTRVSQWVSNNVQGCCGMVSYANIQNTMEVDSLFPFPNLTQSTLVIPAQNHTEMGSAKCSSHFT